MFLGEVEVPSSNQVPKPIGKTNKRKQFKRPSMLRHCLNPDEQKRYDFFNQQRLFIKGITDICEGLRSTEISQRKQELKQKLQMLSVPDNAFIPLCKSTDLFCNVLRPCAEEGHVFSTHERVPCLMLFEVAEDAFLRNVSVALDLKLYGVESDEYEESDSQPNENELLGTNDKKATPPSAPPPSAPPTTTQKTSNDAIIAKLCNVTSFKAPDTSSLQEALFQNEEKRSRVIEIFGELWVEKKKRIRSASPFQDHPNWSLVSMIAKSNDDLRQEVFVMQLISFFQDIFTSSKLPLKLQPYRILSTGASTGLLEVVKNAKSLDAIKKREGYKNLRSHFEYLYGNVDSPEFREAQDNFVASLAGYSLVCYILAIKDRHNGNIMIDVDGRIVHIDFGFLLGRAPGGSFSMETAPFKLTTEMVDVMGGKDSLHFKKYLKACIDGMLAIRQHGETLLTLVEIMSYESTFPCFQGNITNIVNSLRDRLSLHLPTEKVPAVVTALVERSYDHFGTTKYDQFQTYSNGIAR